MLYGMVPGYLVERREPLFFKQGAPFQLGGLRLDVT